LFAHPLPANEIDVPAGTAGAPGRTTATA
jgi:hypothetical protein